MNWSLFRNAIVPTSLSNQPIYNAFVRLNTFVLAFFILGTGLAHAQQPGSVTVKVATKVSTISIPVGDTASYGASVTATPKPDKEWHVISGSVTYSWSASLGTPHPNNASETTVTTDALNQAQVCTSTATCTVSYQVQKSDPGQADDGEVSTISGVNTSKPVTINVVGIAKLQYNDPVNGWTDTSGTIGVLLGTSIQFRALPNPSSASFPSGYPVWSGTAGASGTGPIITVNFAVASTSETDYKTVTATCSKIVGDKGVTVNVIVTNLTLKQISFSGSHPVKNDLDGSTYSTPQWQDNSAPLNGSADDPGDKHYPLCYTQGTTASVSVLLVPYPAIPSGSTLITSGQVKIKGNAAGAAQYGMSEKAATVDNTGVSVSNNLSAAFPPTVYCYKIPPIQIQWFYSGDNGATYHSAGVSDHKVYVTLADPLPTANLFQTVLETGCVAAQGASQAANAASAISGAFTSLSVKRVSDERIMQYWGPISTPNPGIFTTKDLLHSADGRCGAWQNFFIDVLRAQGISSQAILIQDKQPASMPAGLTFDAADSALAVYSSIPAQGNSRPAYRFIDHAVVEIPSIVSLAGKVYDPSYGKVYDSGTLAASQQTWEDTSIDYYLYVYVDSRGAYYSDPNQHPDPKGSRETVFFNTAPNS